MAGSYESWNRLSRQDQVIINSRSPKNLFRDPSYRKKRMKSFAGQRGAFTRGPGENIEIAREGKSMGEAWSRSTDERVHIRDKGFHHPSAEEHVNAVLDKNKNKTYMTVYFGPPPPSGGTQVMISYGSFTSQVLQ